jgi:hypothetical protein
MSRREKPSLEQLEKDLLTGPASSTARSLRPTQSGGRSRSTGGCRSCAAPPITPELRRPRRPRRAGEAAAGTKGWPSGDSRAAE